MLTAPALGAECGGEGQASCTIAKATLVSNKPGQCPGGAFFDPIDGGTCWRCPDGMARTVFHVKSGDACERPLHEAFAKATRHGRATGLLRTDCQRGQFWDPNGDCWSCPGGYRRTAHPVTAERACARTVPPQRAAAQFAASLACPQGSFFDLVDGGTCWKCPEGYGRGAAHVKAGDACAATVLAGVGRIFGSCDAGLVNAAGTCQRRGACGALGERPCLLVERVPSCNGGLAEDFVANRCVRADLKADICKATVGAVGAGKAVAGLFDAARATQERTEAQRNRLRQGPQSSPLLQQVAQALAPHTRMVPELQRVTSLLQSQRGPIAALFTPETFCTLPRAEFDRRLQALGAMPNLPRRTSSAVDWFVRPAHAADDAHFYLGYQVAFSAAAVIGVDVSLLWVTDFRGNGGRYLAVGPQLVTNATIGVTPIGLQFFPKVDLASFTGWGFGGAISGGPPSKVVSAGLDVSFDDKFVFQGFGLSAGIGLGAIPGDLAVSAVHAWKLD
ncbi:MAG: hypothetical protein JNJ89_00575 [Rubrivivax sp.]|nr:hypothetical protein [Rubrivivax sp.]